MRETAHGGNLCNETGTIPLLIKKPNRPLCDMTVTRKELRMARKRLEREEPHTTWRNRRGKTALPFSKVGVSPELPHHEDALVALADFLPVHSNFPLFVAPVEKRDNVPVAKGTRHVEIPNRKIPKHRIELARARRAHGQRLLDQLYAVGGKFCKFVACKRLLPRKRYDGRLNLRLFASESVLRDEHAVRVGPKDI